jgi:hypothetical protein
MKFRVEHIFLGIDLVGYEALYFDEEFNQALCTACKLERGLQNLTIKDGKLTRAVRVAPDREIPAPAAKVLGSNKIEYIEHVQYALGSYRGKWHTVSSIMTDKVESSGTFGFDTHRDGVLRWVEGEVKVKLFGIGAIAERFIGNDIEKSYDGAAVFTQEWINSGKASLPQLLSMSRT